MIFCVTFTEKLGFYLDLGDTVHIK